MELVRRIEAGLTNPSFSRSEKVLGSFEAHSSVFNRTQNEDEETKENDEDNHLNASFSKSGNEDNILEQKPPFIHNTSEVELKNLINDDDKFFSHLQALKTENKKTLKSLERLYNRTQNGCITNESFLESTKSFKRSHSKKHRKSRNGASLEKETPKDEPSELDSSQREALEDLNRSWRECRTTLCKSPSHMQANTRKSSQGKHIPKLDNFFVAKC